MVNKFDSKFPYVQVTNKDGSTYKAICLALGVNQSLVIPYTHRLASPCCIYVNNDTITME
jgi:hypothetical protein